MSIQSLYLKTAPTTLRESLKILEKESTTRVSLEAEIDLCRAQILRALNCLSAVERLPMSKDPETIQKQKELQYGAESALREAIEQTARITLAHSRIQANIGSLEPMQLNVVMRKIDEAMDILPEEYRNALLKKISSITTSGPNIVEVPILRIQ